MQQEITEPLNIEVTIPSNVQVHAGRSLLNFFRKSTRSRKPKEPTVENYFANTFHKAKCSLYVLNGNSSRCFCGLDYMQHSEDAINIGKDELNHMTQWDNSFIRIEPTDTFGVLNFTETSTTPKGSCPFIRLWINDNIEDIITLMRDHWGVLPIGRDTVCISFVGSISVEPTLQIIENIEKTFLDLAILTPIIVFIHGEDNIFSRTIGRIVKTVEARLSFLDARAHPPALIGLISWTELKDNGCLVGVGKVLNYPVTERISENQESDKVTICPYLTHALLLDSGISGSYHWCTQFRPKFLSLLHSRPDMYALEFLWGGAASDLFMYDDLQFTMPVIILRSTGGIAGVLAQAKDFAEFDVKVGEEFRLMNRAVLKKMLTWLLPSDPTTEETLTLFTKCLFNQNKTFLIYDERDEIGQLIDLISDSCETSVCSISKSISFHITFGHAQKLKKLLSTIKEQDMDRDLLYQKFLSVLTANRWDFFTSFMHLGLHLENRVTLNDLHHLYNNATGSQVLLDFLIQKHIISTEVDLQGETVADPKQSTVSFLASTSAVETSSRLQRNSADGSVRVRRIQRSSISRCFTRAGMRDRKRMPPIIKPVIYLNDVSTFLQKVFFQVNLAYYCLDRPRADEEDLSRNMTTPIWHLFIWSVLMGYPEMAKKLLKFCPKPTSMAIMASTYYRHVHHIVPYYDNETRAHYATMARLFEGIATDILEAMEERDQERALALLTEGQPIIGERKLLDVALFGKNIQFTAQTACQEYTERAWTSGIRSNIVVVFSSILLPFLLKFDAINQWGAGVNGDEDLRHMNLLQRMTLFYRSTAIKHMIFYLQFLIFLVLISYSILFDLPFHRLGVAEALAVAFYAVTSVSTAMDFLLVILESGPKKAYIVFFMGSFQLLTQVSFLVTWIYIIIRETEVGGIEALRTFLAIFLLVTSLRILEGLQFYRSFGPLIVLLKKIFPFFIYFLLIIAILLIPYGIAIEVLLSPNNTYSNFGEFMAIFDRPYYNLYGEVGVDEIRKGPEGCDVEPNRIDCHLTYILHFGYMCFAAILVLNLIIAIFSNAYLKYNEISNDLWKHTRLSIAEDYKHKSAVPQPFAPIFQLKDLIMKLRERARINGTRLIFPGAAKTQGDGSTLNQTTEHEEKVARLEKSSLRTVMRNRRIEKLRTVEAAISTAAVALESRIDACLRIAELRRLQQRSSEEDKHWRERRQRSKKVDSMLEGPISRSSYGGLAEELTTKKELAEGIQAGARRLESLTQKIEVLFARAND